MLDNVDLLFTDAQIITLDESNPVIRNGAIAVIGNTIAAIGAADDVRAQCRTVKRTVDCGDAVVMPGMIDAHSHQFQLLGRTLGDGMSLLPWLPACPAARCLARNPSCTPRAARRGRWKCRQT